MMGTTINAVARQAREAPMTCKKNCAPCWNISAVFPRTNNADTKDMKIDAVTGNKDICLLPTKNSLKRQKETFVPRCQI